MHLPHYLLVFRAIKQMVSKFCQSIQTLDRRDEQRIDRPSGHTVSNWLIDLLIESFTRCWPVLGRCSQWRIQTFGYWTHHVVIVAYLDIRLGRPIFYYVPSHHHHQFLTPAIWRRWIRMNDLHCPPSFVKSIAPLNVSSINSMSFLYCLSIVV